jgi:hypothetical protein
MREKADLYVHPQWVHSLVCELVTQSWRAPCKSFVSFKVISAIPFTECFASKLHRVKTQVNFEKHVAHECTNIKPTLGMVTSCTSCVQPDPWLRGINYSPYMITLIQICYIRCTNHISFSNPLWALHTQLLGSLKVGAETVTEEGFIEVSMEWDPSQTFYAQRRKFSALISQHLSRCCYTYENLITKPDRPSDLDQLLYSEPWSWATNSPLCKWGQYNP